MSVIPKSKRLKKELTLFNIYALATGATLSSGFFLLPGLAAAQAGPAVTISYLIAALHLIPAVLSMAELSTAMPRAGGIYYFLDRSLGPMVGTVGGLGTWLALILKTAFALIGMGAYIGIFLPEVPIVPLAIGFAILFGVLNLFGAKKTSKFQIFLVIGLFLILAGVCGQGFFHLKARHFLEYFSKGWQPIYSTAGLVYISYVGLTNIASVSEEVKNPEKNLPLAMMLALVTAIVIYSLGTILMVGTIPPQEFYRDLTPVATSAKSFAGLVGTVFITIAAVLAFFSVANSAILSASRYPLAMSRDQLTPRFFRILNKHRSPKFAIYVTIVLIIACLLLFDPTKIAKLASAFQLLLFALSCLAVIIMRESRLESYDPGYRSPLYPWLHIAGIVAPLLLIVEMGVWPSVFTAGLILAGVAWYHYYARNKVQREGAVYHVFARLGERSYKGLDRELRGILQEKGLREEDPFEMVIARAGVIDLAAEFTFEEVVHKAAEKLSQRLPVATDLLVESFMQGTRVGATPVSHGVALPHLRLPDIQLPEMVIVRAQKGVMVDVDDEFLGEHASDKPVFAFFFLVSPENDPGQHLRLLAQIAGQADDQRFMKHWLKASHDMDLKEILHRDEHFVLFRISQKNKTASMIGQAIRDLKLPEGALIAVIHRGGEIIIPRGRTVLKEHDRLTFIGEPLGIQKLQERYGAGF
ncbi:MAG: amino acid permease [bacterium]